MFVTTRARKRSLRRRLPAPRMCAASVGPEDRVGPPFGLRRFRYAVLAQDAEGSASLHQRAPDLEVDGEMQADTALSLVARQRVISHSRLEGEANVLIFPNLDAGSTALQLTQVIADALPVGPILIGPAKPAHVLTPTVTARGIVT